MDQVAAVYRIGLIEGVLFLLLLLLAFGALTVTVRERWLSLGTTESLLARLAAATLLASIAVGGLSTGLSGLVLNLLQGAALSDATLSATTSRNQAVLGLGLGIAVTAVGVIRIEMYHRRLLSAPIESEDADWKVEPPELAGRR
jgi:hypothetical protein